MPDSPTTTMRTIIPGGFPNFAQLTLRVDLKRMIGIYLDIHHWQLSCLCPVAEQRLK